MKRVSRSRRPETEDIESSESSSIVVQEITSGPGRKEREPVSKSAGLEYGFDGGLPHYCQVVPKDRSLRGCGIQLR